MCSPYVVFLSTLTSSQCILEKTVSSLAYILWGCGKGSLQCSTTYTASHTYSEKHNKKI